MHWFLLVCAILAEMVGTTALKASEGVSRPGPSLVALACFGTALFLMSRVIRVVPVGVTDAIWSGAGIVLIAPLGWIAYGQRLDVPAAIGIALILAGIVVMQRYSDTAGH